MGRIVTRRNDWLYPAGRTLIPAVILTILLANQVELCRPPTKHTVATLSNHPLLGIKLEKPTNDRGVARTFDVRLNFEAQLFFLQRVTVTVKYRSALKSFHVSHPRSETEVRSNCSTCQTRTLMVQKTPTPHAQG